MGGSSLAMALPCSGQTGSAALMLVECARGAEGALVSSSRATPSAPSCSCSPGQPCRSPRAPVASGDWGPRVKPSQAGKSRGAGGRGCVSLANPGMWGLRHPVGSRRVHPPWMHSYPHPHPRSPTALAALPNALYSSLSASASLFMHPSPTPHPHHGTPSLSRRGRGSRVGRRPSAGVRAMAADYYSTLGVAKGASKQDIKSAYRRLARQYHPDVSKEAGAEDKFKSISEAYEVLSDDEKRPLYDRFGEAGVKGGAGMGGPGAAYSATNPFDLFESFFGPGMGGMGGMGGATGRRRGPVPGNDIKMEVSLDFKESIYGAEKRVDVSHLEECEVCSGSGAKPGTAPSTCPTCRGMGQVMQTRQTPFGMFSQVSTCTTCTGTGEVITDFCKKCGGEGRMRVRKPVPLSIPAGVEAGSALRVRGDGDAGLRGGPPGDLYVFVNVREHPTIKRDGMDLYSTIPIDYTDAILGTTAKVNTVDGPAELRVPSGTQPGDTLVLPKRGVPKLGKLSIRGDHFFKINVSVPKRISDVERGLVEELASIRRTGKTSSGTPVSGASRVGESSSKEGGIVGALKSAASGLFSLLKK